MSSSSVHAIRSAGVASAWLVGFESGMITGRSMLSAIARTAAFVNVPGWPHAPRSAVGFSVRRSPVRCSRRAGSTGPSIAQSWNTAGCCLSCRGEGRRGPKRRAGGSVAPAANPTRQAGAVVDRKHPAASQTLGASTRQRNRVSTSRARGSRVRAVGYPRAGYCSTSIAREAHPYGNGAWFIPWHSRKHWPDPGPPPGRGVSYSRRPVVGEGRTTGLPLGSRSRKLIRC
jgi:hypothetical protein